MAVLQKGSKCSHTTCMLRFLTFSRLALNPNLIFEIGSRLVIFEVELNFFQQPQLFMNRLKECFDLHSLSISTVLIVKPESMVL
jgi:hypothetical protein